VGIDAKAGFAGLVTATSEAAGAATGLRVADNVVLRKEGALMPRPVYASSALTPRSWRAVFPYKGTLWHIGASNVVYNPSLATVLISGTSPGAVRDDVQSAKEARGNLYFASSQGIFKVVNAAATYLTMTGVRPLEMQGFVFGFQTGGTLIGPNQQVAYRFVTVKTDVNGVITRSRPTGAQTLALTGGSATYGVQIVYYPTAYDASVVSSIKLELYRTRVFPTTAQVDDEMQLVATFDNPSTLTYFYDNVPDANRGVTLYTSPSRGGLEAANDAPPGAACLERFRGSLFFGNTVGPHRVTFSYKHSGIRTGQATLIGERTFTASPTNGSAALTGVSNTTGLQVGMNVIGGPLTGTGTVANTSFGKIVSIVGTTVTMQNASNATNTGQTFYANDAYTIDGGLPVQLAKTASGVVNNGYTPTNSWGAFTTLGNSFQGYQAYEITPPQPGYDFTVVVERIARGGAAFQMRATHGDEMYPAVPLGNAATGLASTNDVFPHGLAWSEPDEPEHVPPKNFARVGDAGRAILALVATKDRLLIFKEDGLFMLTGDTAKNFAIYPLDTTCLCILPGSVRRLKNTVYALTNLGLAAIDENGGVSVISRPIQLEVASIVNAIRAQWKTTGLYSMPGLPSGVTGAGDDANGEYHLMLGSTAPSFGGHVLVYSLPREGFTTFTFTAAPVVLGTDGEGNPLVLTSSALLTPTTTLGTIAARVSPRAFADPALLGKLWTHVLAGFSQLTGTTNVQAKFTSSASMVAGASITETFDLPVESGTSLLQFPLGSLLRHPVPAAVRRAYMLYVELLINVSSGSFTLETIAAESRENISNKEPTHGSGST
jgi:hypothetical protein